jgi:hypothetical protein
MLKADMDASADLWGSGAAAVARDDDDNLFGGRTKVREITKIVEKDSFEEFSVKNIKDGEDLATKCVQKWQGAHVRERFYL